MPLDHILKRLDFKALSETEQRRYVNRIYRIVGVIEKRFPHVTQPEQIKLKHVQYYRNVWLPEHSPSSRTRSEYMRALGLLVKALRRPDSWLGALGLRPNCRGGRPSEVGVRKSKKF